MKTEEPRASERTNGGMPDACGPRPAEQPCSPSARHYRQISGAIRTAIRPSSEPRPQHRIRTVTMPPPARTSEASPIKQPATRPITEQQLINEVKGIYAGLVMVEKKCVEIVARQTQSQSRQRLSDQQWKALVALHRTLLQEHHDFFSTSQQPAASKALQRVAIKYAMPAHMWRHGIHAFIELLRRRLPDSIEHMLSFIYLAYSMMALLRESVPNFVETWIECLGDLARYRMAIEDSDPCDREIWSNVAKMWYNEAADKSPNVGRIQHHLAVLARPNIVEQLFYYDKALVSVVPFINARETIMLLFLDMFKKTTGHTQYPPAEYPFVQSYALQFTRQSSINHRNMHKSFVSSFGRSRAARETVEEETFPPTYGGIGRQLPEDFVMRGMVSSQHYYTSGLFAEQLLNEQNEVFPKKLYQPRWRLSGFQRFLSNINRRLMALAFFVTAIQGTSARVLTETSVMALTDTSSASQGPGWAFLFYGICGLLTAGIPFLGPHVAANNAVAKASILAFMSSLAVSTAETQHLQHVWHATCAGMSLGSSLWLWRATKSSKNSFLVMLFRYLVITALLWQLLSSSELGDDGRPLDLTRSIPYLSIFGAVAVNAFINEKIIEFGAFIDWVWDRALHWLELERVRTADIV